MEKTPSLKQLPQVKGHWLFKSGIAMAKDTIGFVSKHMKQYGDIYFVDAFRHKLSVVTSPEYAKYILQENHRNYIKSFGYDVLKLLLGQGLLTSEGDFWLRQRRLAQPAFHKKKIESLVELMGDCTQKTIDEITKNSEDGKKINVSALMNKLTLEIVARSLFGSEINEDMETIRKANTIANEFAMQRIRKIALLPMWFPSKENMDFKNAVGVLDQVIYKLIKKRMANKEEGFNDLLSILMDSVDSETGEQMNSLQLRDEVMTLFIAGHETTANALMWLWLVLSQNDQIRIKMQEEVGAVLNGRKPTLEDIPKLKYLRQVIDELLRLYPPAWVIGRRNIEEDEIGGYYIPKGMNLLVMVYHIHRHPKLWKDPEVFDPERFSEENQKNIPKYAYLPFGGGPRMCIGNTFALTEMMVIVSMLVQKFNFNTDNVSLKMEPLITLRPAGDIMMKLDKINE
jgi:cytochrome P450